MSCLNSVANVTSQECVRKNNRHIYITATASTDDCKGMCTDACGIMCTDKKEHTSMRNDAHRSTCTDDEGGMFTDVSTYITGMNRIT